jgi:hypothetical protein
MADVERLAGVDRGQLFLVGAFALAVLFVALAVLLNAAIFTENLSTQGRAPSPGAAVEYREAVQKAGESSVESVNYRNNSTYTDLEDSLGRSTETWSDATAKHRASQGHAANTSVDWGNVTRGTRLTQDVEGNFSDHTDSPDWEVAENIYFRNFTMNVSHSSLAANSSPANFSQYQNTSYLRVRFRDTTAENWRVYVHQNGGNVSVEVIDETESLPAATCEVNPGADGHAVIDFTGATVGGESCEALNFHGDMEGSRTIYIREGGSGNGTYSLVVDATPSVLNPTPAFDEDTDDGQPYFTRAIYAATFEVHYRAPDTDYEARVRVAPGEPDA